MGRIFGMASKFFCSSAILITLLFLKIFAVVHGRIPTTLDGPFKPVTVPFDESLRGKAVDLPDTDPRVRRQVKGFEPEQISVTLSSTYDSVWISWITGLKPDMIYYYRCGDPSIPAMSKIYSFKTMPVSGPQSYPKKIAVVGDLGLTYNTTSTISHLIHNSPDLVLLVGDVTYANLYLTNGTGSDCYSCSFSNTPIHETYQPRWDYWGRFMQPLVSKVPIMVVEGNHEIEPQAENLSFVAYSSRFAFPSKESGSSSTFYYSFNAGGIHFIMLGAYISYNKTGEQYRWLERDLANVDRSVTPWLVATWHPPWYSTYKAHYREAECMMVEMEELLYSYGVDIVFNGHVHAYERSNRVYNYTLDPCGPVYITVGDGGNREKMAITHADEPGNCPDPLSTPDKHMSGFCAFNFTSGPAAGKFCWDRQPDYSAYRESSFGHGILEVKNSTYALWTWHRNQDMYNGAGDQIYIVREADKCQVKPMVGDYRNIRSLLKD
ncbi:purple acid phosphatase 15-like isoform X2 [Telopea speciosissima]|uniref:purple acid phosphatase 15-like isoform X2 n=1 Tax=Telopea speciosissima TaxID=54955 RepID=UPI001CC7389D|nr:purple acid phosphatase 15-like isoform X2 [Telopea speciosissima]